jgi:hypothetical protein
VANDPQSLNSQAQCYLCFGVSETEALGLALLANIANATVTPITPVTPLEPMVIDLFAVGQNNPVAATTYFVGKFSVHVNNTVYGFAIVDIPRAGTIKRVFYFVDQGVAGTVGQNITHAITINNAVDVAVSAFDYSVIPTSSVVNLSQAVNQGDAIAFKITTPAVWTTPATSVRMFAQVYIE